MRTTEREEPNRADPFARLRAGDRATLARAISLLESGGEKAAALARRLQPLAGRARVIAFTGPPGAGKSTLLSAYISLLRARDEAVAVLAVDPTSPLSGGAILGDRARMNAHAGDPGVFIRSIAARGHLGGLALSIPGILDAVDAAGWPTVILETVGAGQSETEIAEIADVKVVLNAPGLGDEVQAIKAGILEIADVLVVNKCDLPNADRTARQLRSMIELRPPDRQAVPVVQTSATTGDGLDCLQAAIADALDTATAVPPERRIARRLRGQLLSHAETVLRQGISHVPESSIDDLCASLRAGEQSIAEAALQLNRLALQHHTLSNRDLGTDLSAES